MTTTVGQDAPRILLDMPAKQPELGFPAIAAALATSIRTSEPRFAIGIFGSWGSGKTTLMNAIANELATDQLVIVQFNAWRYEKEPHLIVPLLDTVRSSLITWAKAAQRRPEAAERARGIARKVGTVVRAFATGLSAQVGVGSVAKVTFDVGKALQAMGATDPDPADSPQSMYFAAFNQLSSAFEEVQAAEFARIVVFVDDLDRCLPANALDLLESMKLFFDLPGFVFVVGVDQNVVERAVQAKFPAHDRPGMNGSSMVDRTELEYVKKIFQVPYALPPMTATQLDDLMKSIYTTAGLGPTQLDDLRRRVRGYLGYIAVEGRINPREVKRFINAYTLQTMIRPKLDQDTVLALQTLEFRRDWEEVYDVVLAESDVFLDALSHYRTGDDSAFENLWPQLGLLPSDLILYLRSPAAEPLTRQPNLDEYIYSLHATRNYNSALNEAYRDVGQLRKEVRRVTTEVRALGDANASAPASEMSGTVARLAGFAQQQKDNRRLLRIVEALQRAVAQLSPSTAQESKSAEPGDIAEWVRSTGETVDQLQRELRVIRDSSAWSATP
ncbi:KAP family P-loop NTPase fold protein [Nonomuraea sp. NPDC003707]